MPELLLASTSPRRRRLLKEAGLSFLLCEPGDEHAEGEPAEPIERARLRARRKAFGARASSGDLPVLGVDTVVDLDGRELGKPLDEEEARAMLRSLAGRDHRVHTAHCLVAPGSGESVEEVASASVRCRPPSDDELAAYLASGAWRGKAGGYGIQDEEQSFLTLVAGAFDTVVGLHVDAVRRLLAESAR